MKDYILKNGKVYNSQSRCFEEKNIVVSEGKITAMEAGIEKEGITEINLEGMIALPGIDRYAYAHISTMRIIGRYTSDDRRRSTHVSKRRDNRSRCGKLRM